MNLIRCKEIPHDNHTTSLPPVNMAMYTILPYDSTAMLAMDWYYDNGRPDSLTSGEVDSLEPIVDSAYRAFTKDSTVYQHNLLPLEQYRRQYVAVQTATGEKHVWVNFLCADFNIDWRNTAVIVDDGGNCYFQLFINVTSRKAFKLIPGGSA